jgi:hypothetical protein
MAAKEIKSTSVAPEDEEDTVNLWQSFGWELKNNQEVKNTDSHLERRGDDVYSVTNTEHYVKLTFERDPGRQNYAELKSLEGQYYGASHPGAPPKRFGTIFVILIVISLFFGIGGIISGVANSYNGPMFVIISGIVGLVFLAPAVLIIVFRTKSFPKRLQPWTDAYDLYTKTRADALGQAKSLV